jgi:hypothetical protein
MGPHPATIAYHSEIRRQEFLDVAARYRMIKQVHGERPSEPRFGGIRTSARRALDLLATTVVPGVTRRSTA